MANLRTKTVLVYDYGQFVELARSLSPDFGRTLYFAPWTDGGVPTSRSLRIGEGIEGIERITEIWPYLDEVDLFVFPDVHEAALQEYLVSLGKRVWGCRSGGELELDRVKSKEISKRLGIDIPSHTLVTGLDALRRHLKANEDQWVKIPVTRGDVETFHAPDYHAAEPLLDKLEHSLGAQKKLMEFIVEDSIAPAVEVGYDGYTVDGAFPKSAIIGVEAKDEAYLGRAIAYNDIPNGVRTVNQKLKSALRGYRYRGWLSTEVRCTPEGKVYLIDPCARCGSPPSELYPLMIANWAEILWEGAEGILIEPEFKAKWGAEVLLNSDWAVTNWQQVDFPRSIREHVKLRNLTMIDGESYVVPHQTGCLQIGAVVATGNTADEAIAECRRIAELVTGHAIDKPVAALDKARDQLAELLGDKMDDKPLSKMARAVADLRSRGMISDKQAQRLENA